MHAARACTRGDMSGKKKPPEVPKPPEIKRRVSFNPTQAIALPILLIFPVLGIVGLFNTRSVTVRADTGGPGLQVQYPARLRDKTTEPLEVVATNQGPSTGDLEIRIDRNYLSQFEDHRFDPSPDEIDQNSYIFKFEKVEPGAERRVNCTFEADHLGTHEGEIIASAGGTGASVNIRTVVLP